MPNQANPWAHRPSLERHDVNMVAVSFEAIAHSEDMRLYNEALTEGRLPSPLERWDRVPERLEQKRLYELQSAHLAEMGM
jgi:carbamoylphosphate synthase large subunit